MEIRTYEHLPEEARRIRQQVFVEEQGFQEEFDETDDGCVHILLWEKDQAVATGRVYYNKEHCCYGIGRLAVCKAYRGCQYGKAVLEAAEQVIAERQEQTAGLSAQLRVKGFYEKMGYEAKGEIYLDQECPHVWMEKRVDIPLQNS